MNRTQGFVIAAVATMSAFGSTEGLQRLSEAGPGTVGIVFVRKGPAGGQRLVLVRMDGSRTELAASMYSSADPDVSFDGKRVVFSAKKTAAASWSIYEVAVEGGEARLVVGGPAPARHPIYQSEIFNLAHEQPWRQIAFVRGGALHSARLDGSDVSKLTHGPWQSGPPVLLGDGRMVFAARPAEGAGWRLFGVNLDGTDFALFNGEAVSNLAVGAMGEREAVFVDEKGGLGAVHMDRPLSTRRMLKTPEGYRLSAASWAPGGLLLVAATQTGKDSGVYLLDPESGRMEVVADEPGVEETDPIVVAVRNEPDGRGSIVDETDGDAQFYSLSVFTTDAPAVVNPQTAKRVRVVEWRGKSESALGEVPLEADGSFHAKVKANAAVRFDLIGETGKLLRSSGWVWSRNHENRGCIGCHEDPELSPENREAAAVIKPAARMTGPSPGSVKVMTGSKPAAGAKTGGRKQ